MLMVAPIFEIKPPNISAILGGSRIALTEVLQGSEPATAAAIVLVDLIKQILSQGGTGRIYKRRGGVHQASAPGEPPAPDTGNLRNAIGFQIIAPGRVGIGVEAGASYWRFLEFGTRFIDPRPFLRPAITFGRAGMTDVAAVAFRARARRILAQRTR